MRQSIISTYQALFFAIPALVFIILVSTFPLKTSALEASTQTSQILPVGNNSCESVTASGITTYIYDDALHSFEFTISDTSYIAILGSVGDTSIPFYAMTREINSSGKLRIHADITPVSGAVPLTVTLISARSGKPTCLTVVSMSVVSGSIPSNSMSMGPVSSVIATSNASSVVVTSTPASDLRPSSTPQSTSTISATASNTISGSVLSTRNPFGDMCTSDAGAHRFWSIILIFFTLVIATALWVGLPTAFSWARTPESVAIFILTLLLAILALWYLSISCRVAIWVPFAALLIAVIGLLAAFWNHPRVTQLLLSEVPKG